MWIGLIPRLVYQNITGQMNSLRWQIIQYFDGNTIVTLDQEKKQTRGVERLDLPPSECFPLQASEVVFKKRLAKSSMCFTKHFSP